jgi:hypothetical protein
MALDFRAARWVVANPSSPPRFLTRTGKVGRNTDRSGGAVAGQPPRGCTHPSRVSD